MVQHKRIPLLLRSLHVASPVSTCSPSFIHLHDCPLSIGQKDRQCIYCGLVTSERGTTEESDVLNTFLKHLLVGNGMEQDCCKGQWHELFICRMKSNILIIYLPSDEDCT
jgi:hypothetical protein